MGRTLNIHINSIITSTLVTANYASNRLAVCVAVIPFPLLLLFLRFTLNITFLIGFIPLELIIIHIDIIPIHDMNLYIIDIFDVFPLREMIFHKVVHLVPPVVLDFGLLHLHLWVK